MKSRKSRKSTESSLKRASARRRHRRQFELLEQREMMATDVLRQSPIGIVGEAVREIRARLLGPADG